MALEWLAGEKMLDTLPATRKWQKRILRTLLPLLSTDGFLHCMARRPAFPLPDALINALESRLAQSGGMNAVVRRTAAAFRHRLPRWMRHRYRHHFRARPARPGESAGPLSERQPQGWLSAHRLMKTLRWDTGMNCRRMWTEKPGWPRRAQNTQPA